MNTISVRVGPGLTVSERQEAEVTVLPNGSIWLTFLGPRGGRQYTLPLSALGAADLGRLLRDAATASKVARP